jgi:hypothetical protein
MTLIGRRDTINGRHTDKVKAQIFFSLMSSTKDTTQKGLPQTVRKLRVSFFSARFNVSFSATSWDGKDRVNTASNWNGFFYPRLYEVTWRTYVNSISFFLIIILIPLSDLQELEPRSSNIWYKPQP